MKTKLTIPVIPESVTNAGKDWLQAKKAIGESQKKFADLEIELKEIGQRVGKGSDAFEKALSEIKKAVLQDADLKAVIKSPLYVRALGSASLELGKRISLDKQLFEHLDSIRQRPGIVLLEDLRQYYLTHYDELRHRADIEDWLLSALKKRGELNQLDENVYSKNGAKWLAEQCISKEMEFDKFVCDLELDNYQTGRFINVAQQIYFVERLKDIPVNDPHPLLEEVQKEAVYDTFYEGRELLGHEILNILISRAPANDVHESWQNVVMKIAGDPRVSRTHPRYLKWWLHIDQSLIHKVMGWLSHMDLKLFLEALEDYSNQSGNEELRRMYPARKRFLAGLLEQKLVTGTRLYLTWKFKDYIKKHYKDEHLPELYSVSNNDKSIIHVQLGETQLIEGSHNFKLWVYKRLLKDAVVFDYNKKTVSFSDLTSELSHKMFDEEGRHLLVDSITHHPPLLWQKKAIDAMKEAGVAVDPEQVLTIEDYKQFKRKYGVIL